MDQHELAHNQRHTLRKLREAVLDLRRELTSIESDAAKALRDLDNGLRISGAHNVGPLGHQAPFDLAKYTNRVGMLIDQAQMLGCSQDDINAAYTAKGL